ncbi:methyltransferase domain-containing protein [Corynebacterium sp. SCR221107]|uniref:class I SAM-dependent methyltransferase n=1 Tax=Corynebacterium sp. SCR221107 TaxID=3017361 RepID=UPI0022EC49F9|nr:class I SAM-dependent methyltransferase [Corynebacterium sp. SCR221107]WBT09626.1 methyltransferase domain-containing protein [Corynebacterium sp. SCR221107]
MVTTITEQIWASSDYAPLAERVSPAIAPLITSLQESLKGRVGATVLDIGAGHGHLTRQLIANGYDVTALEPVQAMIDVGQRFCPKATWMRAFAEDTGLADESFDAIASNFGSFICTNDAVGDEWARLLRPGAPLVMTAWDHRGFFAEMTLRMEACFRDVPILPPHMRWAQPGVAQARLGSRFRNIEITEHEIPWEFESVAAGMNFYLHGSPIHTFSFNRSDAVRRQALKDALRQHLEENTNPDGTISSYAGFVIISAIASS